jgi:hypothetical protein
MWEKRRLAILGALGAWLATSALGFAVLMRYETRPGKAADAPAVWPTHSRLPRVPDGWTLLVFLHPHCPCSFATLNELTTLEGQAPQSLHIVLVFCRPEGVPVDWEKSSLWTQAAAMAQVYRHSDDGDRERQRFGAAVSGQVLLYDSSGHLRFVGGITRGRGQQGENLGRTTIVSILQGKAATGPISPVFGCPLADQPQAAEGRACPCQEPP